jgi:hypothetical protein
MKTAHSGSQVRPFCRILLVLAVLLAPWLLPSIQAQVLYGAIVGSVKDATGGVLPGATVIVTHNETKATRETPATVYRHRRRCLEPRETAPIPEGQRT